MRRTAILAVWPPAAMLGEQDRARGCRAGLRIRNKEKWDTDDGHGHITAGSDRAAFEPQQALCARAPGRVSVHSTLCRFAYRGVKCEVVHGTFFTIRLFDHRAVEYGSTENPGEAEDVTASAGKQHASPDIRKESGLFCFGWLAEWLKAPACKAGDRQIRRWFESITIHQQHMPRWRNWQTRSP